MKVKVDKKVTATFVLTERTEPGMAPGYMARIVVDCDGRGVPLSVRIGDHDPLSAELVERLGKAIKDLRAEHEGWDGRTDCCTDHGYYQPGSAYACPACAAEESKQDQ